MSKRRKMPEGWADEETILVQHLRNEIGRLRAVIRVNALRWGHTDAEIDEILNQQSTQPTEPPSSAGS